MGACASKSNKELYQLQNYDTAWYFTEDHENELNEFLKQYHLDILTNFIMSYLQNYTNFKFSKYENNYHSYIHSSITHLNHDCDGKLPEEWLNEHNRDFNIALLGDRSGRTSLIQRLFCNEFYEYGLGPAEPAKVERDSTGQYEWYRKRFTLNVSKENYDSYEFFAIESSDDAKVRINILDGKHEDWSGQAVYTLDTFDKNDIFLLVFDVSSKYDFEYIKNIRLQVIYAKKNQKIKNKKDAKDYVIIAVGNQCDNRDHIKANNCNDQLNMDDVDEWIIQNNIPYIETSAKTGQNVFLLFRQCIYEYWLTSIIGSPKLR